MSQRQSSAPSIQLVQRDTSSPMASKYTCALLYRSPTSLAASSPFQNQPADLTACVRRTYSTWLMRRPEVLFTAFRRGWHCTSEILWHLTVCSRQERRWYATGCALRRLIVKAAYIVWQCWRGWQRAFWRFKLVSLNLTPPKPPLMPSVWSRTVQVGCPQWQNVFNIQFVGIACSWYRVLRDAGTDVGLSVCAHGHRFRITAKYRRAFADVSVVHQRCHRDNRTVRLCRLCLFWVWQTRASYVAASLEWQTRCNTTVVDLARSGIQMAL
jgi:hypothetical protein